MSGQTPTTEPRDDDSQPTLLRRFPSSEPPAPSDPTAVATPVARRRITAEDGYELEFDESEVTGRLPQLIDRRALPFEAPAGDRRQPSSIPPSSEPPGPWAEQRALDASELPSSLMPPPLRYAEPATPRPDSRGRAVAMTVILAVVVVALIAIAAIRFTVG